MPRRKAVSLYDLSRGKKRLYTLWKVRGGYQSLFPCLGEGTHVITLRLVLRYPMSKCREQKRRACLNLRAPKRKAARGWKNKIKNKYKNQEIFSLPPRLSQFYQVEILARTGVFHILLLIPWRKGLVVYVCVIKWWRVKLRKKFHARFVQILIISRAFRRGKLLGFGQNASEIIP